VLLIGIIDYFWVIRPLQQKAMLYEKNKDESIHKVGFSAEKARNMGQMDAIVIGSGMILAALFHCSRTMKLTMCYIYIYDVVLRSWWFDCCCPTFPTWLQGGCAGAA